MDKVGYPRGLIRYSTQNAIDGKYTDKEIVKHTLRPRTLAYTFILTAICVAFVYTLANRVPLRADVLRDRLVLSRLAENGQTENLYRLQVINMDSRPHRYRISVSGIDGLQMMSGESVDIAALGTENVNVVLRLDSSQLKRPSQPIVFTLRAEDDSSIVREAKSSFLK
jgi:polyferredoxin